MNFVSDCRRILSCLGETSSENVESGTDADILKRTAQILQQFASVLLVLDNADDFDIFIGKSMDGFDLRTVIPQSAAVIITTRDQRFLGSFVPARQGCRVVPFEDHEAARLLLRSVPSHLANDASNTFVKELLDELGKLPLAIAQAAANIRELQMSLTQYIRAYREKRDRMALMQEPAFDEPNFDSRQKPMSILVTWELSFEHLENKFPSSALCLNVLGLFHWRGIPADLLMRWPDFSEMSWVSFQGVMKRLLQLSLVEVSNDTESLVEYSVHPLVHERIAERLIHHHASKFHELLEPAIRLTAGSFPFLGSQPLVVRKSTDFVFARYMLPHVIHQIGLIREHGIRTRPGARLLQITARYFMIANLTNLSVEMSTRAMDMAQEVWADDEYSRYLVRKIHVNSLCHNAEYDMATTEARMCLDMLESQSLREALGTQENVEMERLSALHELTVCMFELLHSEERLDLMKQTLAQAIKIGMDAEQTRALRFNVAYSLVRDGCVEEGLRLTEELLGEVSHDPKWIAENKTETMVWLNNKAKAAVQLAANSESRAVQEAYNETALATYREVFQHYAEHEGAENLNTWKAANSLIGMLVESTSTASLKEAMISSSRMLIIAKDAEIVMQGQFLETFTIFISYVVLLQLKVMSIPAQHYASSGQEREFLVNFFDYVSEQQRDLEEIFLSNPSLAHSWGIYLRCTGHFKEAENFHRCALEIFETRGGDRISQFENNIHYNIMLAVSHQDGRLKEAYVYRAQHLTKIEVAEAKHGGLDKRVERFRAQQLLLEQARTELLRGELNQRNEWFNENEDELLQAQRMWGWLNLPFEPYKTTELHDEQEKQVQDPNDGLLDTLSSPKETPDEQIEQALDPEQALESQVEQIPGDTRRSGFRSMPHRLRNVFGSSSHSPSQ